MLIHLVIINARVFFCNETTNLGRLKRVLYGEIMRYKTDEDRERERQDFLVSLAKTKADLDRRIQSSRKEKEANELLSKYEKKPK